MKTEFSSYTDKELAEKLASLKSELFNLRFAHSTGSLANTSSISACKRNIARVKTVMRFRQSPDYVPEQVPEKEVTKKSTKTKKTAKVDAEVKG